MRTETWIKPGLCSSPESGPCSSVSAVLSRKYKHTSFVLCACEKGTTLNLSEHFGWNVKEAEQKQLQGKGEK